MISIAKNAMLLRKTESKKSIGELHLNVDEGGKVIAFCLLIYNYLNKKEIAIPTNFKNICISLSGIVQAYITK
jgi:hypothetical protein